MSEIILAPVKVKPLSAIDRRVLDIDGGKAIFQSGCLAIGERQRMLRIGTIEGGGIYEGIVCVIRTCTYV